LAGIVAKLRNGAHDCQHSTFWIKIKNPAYTQTVGRPMLIDRRCRLRAAVAICAVEIEGGDAKLAEGAFECGAAPYRRGYVISHTLTVAFLPVLFWDKRCATLEQETFR
jgi:hypothetical protein